MSQTPQTAPALELLPAVDVQDGQAVRLVQGEADAEPAQVVQREGFNTQCLESLLRAGQGAPR